VSGAAVLAIGLAWLADVGAARAQGDVKEASSLKKLEAFLAELQQIKQALDKKKADLEEIRQLHDALLRKQAELASTDADLKKRTAKIRDWVAKLVPKAPSPIMFPSPNPPIKYPIIIFPLPKPAPCPPPRWPHPWPPPEGGRYPGGIIPFGTPGGPMGPPQSMSPMPGMMPQR